MTDNDSEMHLTWEEISRLEKTAQIASEIQKMQEACLEKYIMLRPEAPAQESTEVGHFILEQRSKFQDYQIGLSYNVTPKLSQDRHYKKLKATALLGGVDITLCTFAFREAYQLIHETLPLLEDDEQSKLRSHITGANCLMHLPLFNIKVLRQAGKIRSHIKEALLLGKGMPGCDIRDSLDKIIWAEPLPMKDIQLAHRAAQLQSRSPFEMPTLLKDILEKGKD